MGEKKGLGRKVLGVFLSTGDSAPESAADEISNITKDLGLKGEPLAPPPMVVPAAQFDLRTLFEHAGIDAAHLEALSKVRALLQTFGALPAEARQTALSGTLQVMGIDPAAVAVTAQVAQRALDAYVKVARESATKRTGEVEETIRGLQRQIAEAQSKVTSIGREFEGIRTTCESEKVSLSTVIATFPSPKPQ